MNSKGSWIRVTRHNPCPVCHKPDNCEVSRDGLMVWCGRVSEGSIRQNAGGQFLHRLGDHSFAERPAPPRRDPSPSRKPSSRSRTLLQLRALKSFNRGEVARTQLATQIGVSTEALFRLRVGWDADESVWEFPERDADGDIIGINRRYADGQKKRVSGGKSGLTYARDWDTGEGPVFLVEGGSDTAALMSLGLNAIGRPSNTGGADLLMDMLEFFPLSRRIVVVGERDQKPDGKWPGRDGAKLIASKLAAGVSRQIDWTLPPDNSKDARNWLNQMQVTELPADRLQVLFLDGLQFETVLPPPIYRRVEVEAPTVSIDDWRRAMLKARISSLNKPGYYMDSSPTGAGKSSVDIALLLHVLNTEVA